MSPSDVPSASAPPPTSRGRFVEVARWYASTWTMDWPRWRYVLGSVAFIAAVIVTSVIGDRDPGPWTASLVRHPLAALLLAACLAAWAWLDLPLRSVPENRVRKVLIGVRVLMWLAVLVFAGPLRPHGPGWVPQVWAAAFVGDAALSFRRAREWDYKAAAFAAVAALLLWQSL